MLNDEIFHLCEDLKENLSSGKRFVITQKTCDVKECSSERTDFLSHPNCRLTLWYMSGKTCIYICLWWARKRIHQMCEDEKEIQSSGSPFIITQKPCDAKGFLERNFYLTLLLDLECCTFVERHISVNDKQEEYFIVWGWDRKSIAWNHSLASFAKPCDVKRWSSESIFYLTLTIDLYCGTCVKRHTLLKEHCVFCHWSQYKVTHCLTHTESWINKAKTCSPVISLVTHQGCCLLKNEVIPFQKSPWNALCKKWNFVKIPLF